MYTRECIDLSNYRLSKADVENQVREAEIFCNEVRKYIEKQVGDEA